MPASGIDIGKIQDALFAWAVIGSGLNEDHVIWMYGEGTKPSKPFVELNLVGPSPVMGRDYLQVADPDSDDHSALEGSRQFTVTVNVFGDPSNNVGVQQLASDLATSLQIQQLADALYEAGIGVAEVRKPIDVSTLLETKWERQFQFDFDINVASNVDLDAAGFKVPVIEISPIKSTFN